MQRNSTYIFHGTYKSCKLKGTSANLRSLKLYRDFATNTSAELENLINLCQENLKSKTFTGSVSSLQASFWGH